MLSSRPCATSASSIETVDDFSDLVLDLQLQARQIGVHLTHARMPRQQRRRLL